MKNFNIIKQFSVCMYLCVAIFGTVLSGCNYGHDRKGMLSIGGKRNKKHVDHPHVVDTHAPLCDDQMGKTAKRKLITYENLLFEGHKCIQESLDEKGSIVDEKGGIDGPKNVTLVMGPTKSGKSTLIGFLMGAELEKHYVEYIPEDDGGIESDSSYNSGEDEGGSQNAGQGEFHLIYKDGNESEDYPVIGKNIESGTLTPKIFHNKEHNVAFCDTAGLFDNRGGVEKHFSNDFLDMILSAGRLNNIVFVIEKACLDAVGGRTFDDTIKKIGMMIDFLKKSGVTEEVLKERLFLFINKCENPSDKNIVLQKLQAKSKFISKKILEICQRIADLADNAPKNDNPAVSSDDELEKSSVYEYEMPHGYGVAGSYASRETAGGYSYKEMARKERSGNLFSQMFESVRSYLQKSEPAEEKSYEHRAMTVPIHKSAAVSQPNGANSGKAAPQKANPMPKRSSSQAEYENEYRTREFQDLFFEMFKNKDKKNKLSKRIIITSSKRLLDSKFRTHVLKKLKAANEPINLNRQHSLISPDSILSGCLNDLQGRIMNVYDDIHKVDSDLKYIDNKKGAIEQLEKDIENLKSRKDVLESDTSLCLEVSDRESDYVPWYVLPHLGFNKVGINILWRPITIKTYSKVKKVKVYGKNIKVRSYDTSSFFDYDDYIKLGLDTVFSDNTPAYTKTLHTSTLKDFGVWIIPQSRNGLLETKLYSKKNELQSTLRQIERINKKITDKDGEITDKKSDNAQKGDPQDLIENEMPALYTKLLLAAEGPVKDAQQANAKQAGSSKADDDERKTLEQALHYSKQKLDMLKFWGDNIYGTESQNHTDYENIQKACNLWVALLQDIDNNKYNLKDKFKDLKF